MIAKVEPDLRSISHHDNIMRRALNFGSMAGVRESELAEDRHLEEEEQDEEEQEEEEEEEEG